MSASVTFTIAGGDEAEAFKRKIREEALKKGVSVSEYITEAIAEYLRSQVHAD